MLKPSQRCRKQTIMSSPESVAYNSSNPNLTHENTIHNNSNNNPESTQNLLTNTTSTSSSSTSTTTTTAQTSSPPPPSANKFIKVGVAIIIGLCFLGLVILAAIPGSPVKQGMESFIVWTGEIPWWMSCIVISLSYALSLVVMLPGTPFNLAAGFMFGAWLGTGVAMLGALLGAVSSFFLGRTLLRSWAEGFSLRRPRLRALDKAVADQGTKLVFLSRLSPLLPFAVLNYFFGVTKVTLLEYTVATAFGLLPFTALYCYFGTLLRDMTDIWNQNSGDGNGGSMFLLICSAFITLLSLVVITLITRNALNRALANAGASDPSSTTNSDHATSTSIGAEDIDEELLDVVIHHNEDHYEIDSDYNYKDDYHNNKANHFNNIQDDKEEVAPLV